ncbi:MAG TPA: sulfite exporter TauE/SafE family protein [Pseudonocardiaceae bacterium]|jgi:uncharacterized membrane protein YfcA|nr:sulfite exporter TauE/SafE family protein [Pseudonocardiaceae bacterium]
MHLDLALGTAGLVVGLLVGLLVSLIGRGGARLTPLRVLFFQVAPLAAVSSDLLTSLVMMPVSAAVHLRCRTVNWRLVRWLTVGAVPAVFAGAVVIGTIPRVPSVQAGLKLAIGIALCASVGMTLLRRVFDRRASLRGDHDDRPPVVHPLRTVAIGVVGGFATGMTSVGGGSLVFAQLVVAYPRQLHPVQLAATSLLLGALPGVYLGARLSTRGPAAVIRPVIVAVLLASGLAMLKVSTLLTIGAAVAGLITTVLL